MNVPAARPHPTRHRRRWPRVTALIVAVASVLLTSATVATGAPTTAAGQRPAATVAATPCKKVIRVVTSVDGDWFTSRTQLMAMSHHGCWSIINVSQSVPGAANCVVDSAKTQWWAYNEISWAAGRKTADRTLVRACSNRAKANGPNSFGWLLYAYGGNGTWGLTGHVPPRIGNFYELLELYSRKTDIVSDNALNLWNAHGSTTVGAMVNFAGGTAPADNAAAGAATLKVCRQTVDRPVPAGTTKPKAVYMGLYAGHNEAPLNSAGRITAIGNALNTCTL